MLSQLNIVFSYLGLILMSTIGVLLLFFAARSLYSRYYWNHYFSKPWWKREVSFLNRNPTLKLRDD